MQHKTKTLESWRLGKVNVANYLDIVSVTNQGLLSLLWANISSFSPCLLLLLRAITFQYSPSHPSHCKCHPEPHASGMWRDLRLTLFWLCLGRRAHLWNQHPLSPCDLQVLSHLKWPLLLCLGMIRGHISLVLVNAHMNFFIQGLAHSNFSITVSVQTQLLLPIKKLTLFVLHQVLVSSLT